MMCFAGKVLFDGTGEFSVLNSMFALLGTPNTHIWPGYSQLPHAQSFDWNPQPINRLRSIFPAPLASSSDDLLSSIRPPVQESNADTATGASSQQASVTSGADTAVRAARSADVNHDRARPSSAATGKAVVQCDLDEVGFDLLLGFLVYDPQHRITAEQALCHEWFKRSPLAASAQELTEFLRQVPILTVDYRYDCVCPL